MESVQAIVLGHAPTDPDEGDSRVTNMMKILEKGFPDGIIALCSQCQAFQEYGLDEVAVMIVDRKWPWHCNQRMLMEDPERAPSF